MNIPRIMVVDDDPSIRNFVQANLKARGYKVLTAADGEEAIRIAEKEKPELINKDRMTITMDCRPQLVGWGDGCIKTEELINYRISAI